MSEQVIAAFMGAAASQLGRFYPGVSPYGQWYDDTYGGGKGIYDNGQFCAMGLSWAANRAGIPTDVFPPHAYTPSGAAWFRARGQFTKGVAGIRRGDIWYSSCAGLGRISHVGIVESVNRDGSFNTIEFNTAGTYEGDQRNGRMVARKRRNTACSLGGYARPAYPSTAGALKPGTGSTFTPTPSEEDDMNKDQDAALAAIYANQARLMQVIEALDVRTGNSERGNLAIAARQTGEIHSKINWTRHSDGTPMKIAVQGDVDILLRAIAGIRTADVDEAAVARAVVALMPAGVTLDPQALAAAVVDEHAKRLKG